MDDGKARKIKTQMDISKVLLQKSRTRGTLEQVTDKE